MRRFVRTFTVRRHAQLTVVQDGEGDSPSYAVLRWAAADQAPEVLACYPYPPGDHDRREAARNAAIADAAGRADDERAWRTANATGEGGEP